MESIEEQQIHLEEEVNEIDQVKLIEIVYSFFTLGHLTLVSSPLK